MSRSNPLRLGLSHMEQSQRFVRPISLKPGFMNEKDVLENESELRPTTEEDSERVEEEVVEISGEGIDELAENSSTEETVTPRTVVQSTTQKKKDVLENESELRPITEEDSERVEEEVLEILGEGSDELAEHSSTEETVTPRTIQSTPQKKKVSWWKLTAIAAGSVVGGATVVVAAPLVVAGLGFTAGGIASGSIAASMMSAMAPTVAGGIVATLQSVGAAGFSAAGVAALAGAGGTVGAAATAGTVALASRRENENESSETAEDETT
ncbi:uncharacterized protein LOC135342207 isoform X1 [Halichondria panicea]|uniref:uncharacterized protein LOC135342207 isoform X1 n=1 Tax=Halichondria panicea TaxID=6063 RepID=UPI00312B2FD9